VVADTVQAYVELCGATRAIAQASDVAAAQDRSLALVREQLAAGDVSPLEVAQAATLAASTRAAIAPFEAQRRNALYRLATLQGRPPAEAATLGLACAAQPRLRAAPVGDGSALLLRRPDIREAERKLAAASARVGVARADLYPRLNLGGAAGLLAGGFTGALTPLVSWAFPNVGPARAKLGQARAGERAALAGWDVAVLKALREVESAIAVYDAEQRRNQALATATREAEAYARRAAARVRLGDAPGLLRTDAERALATARLQQAQSAIALSQAEVALFRALGGGWRTGAGAV
jgi:outer membrane protein TolC